MENIHFMLNQTAFLVLISEKLTRFESTYNKKQQIYPSKISSDFKWIGERYFI